MITIERQVLVDALVKTRSRFYNTEIRFNNDPTAPFGYGTLDFIGCGQRRETRFTSTGADFSLRMDPVESGRLLNRMFALTGIFEVDNGRKCTLEVDGDVLVLTWDYKHWEFPILGPAEEPFQYVVLMRGLPGSGKSTWIKENLPHAMVVSADHYFIQDDGEYVFDPDSIEKAHDACKMKFWELQRNGCPVIVVDNTNVTVSEMEFYISEAKPHYQVYIQEVGRDLTVEELFQRCVHGVPFETIARRMEAWEEYAR